MLGPSQLFLRPHGPFCTHADGPCLMSRHLRNFKSGDGATRRLPGNGDCPVLIEHVSHCRDSRRRRQTTLSTFKHRYSLLFVVLLLGCLNCARKAVKTEPKAARSHVVRRRSTAEPDSTL